MQTLLVGLVALFGYMDPFLGKSQIQRPIVMGPLVGLVLGDLEAGLAVGATLELAFMGNMAIGAAIPPEITAGGILGTAFAITSGSGADVAVALALPIATMALLVKNLFLLFIRPQFMLHPSDRYAERGDVRGVERMHLLGFWAFDLGMAAVVTLSFHLGSGAVQGLLDMIPAFVLDGISIASGMLPALGFAMLTNMLISDKVAPFFFLGFLASAYLEIPVLGIALLACVLVAILLKGTGLEKTVAPELSCAAAADDDDF